MTSISISTDLRNRFGPARDQGRRQTCLAFATSDVHASKISQTWDPLSCEYLFYHAKQIDNTPPTDGTTVGAITAALKNEGQPSEGGWPYLSALPGDISQWAPPGSVGDIYCSDTTQPAVDFDCIWNSVESQKPLIIAMYLSMAFFAPDNDGVIDSSELPDVSMMHALVALATGKVGSNRLILVRNSWGATWGLAGHCWVSEAYMTPRVFSSIQLQ